MNKKILSVVCVLALVLSASFIPIRAAEKVDNYENTKLFLEQLGVFEDTEELTDTAVSRELFTALLINALKSGVSSEENSFSDVESSNRYLKQISVAATLGIVNKGTAFEPKREIGRNEAVKMLVTALGYEKFALAQGGYPTGYLAIAGSEKLLSGVGNSQSVSGREVVFMLFNFLCADVMRPTGVSSDETHYESFKGESLLTENYGLTKISGVITVAGHYSMSTAAPSSKALIEVGGICLNTSIENGEELLGYNADVWYDGDAQLAHAVYIKNINTVTQVLGKDVSSYSDNSLRVFNKSGRTDTIKIDKGFTFVRNGRIAGYSGGDFADKFTELTLIDNNNDGEADVVLAKKAEYAVTDCVNYSAQTFYDVCGGGAWSFAQRDGFWYSGSRCNDITGTYENVNFNMLENGELLQIYASDDREVCVFTVEEGKVSGTVTEIDNDGIKIGDTFYKTNSYFEKNADFIEIGASRTFLLDSAGSVTYVQSSQKNTMQYGYLIGFYAGKSMSDSAKIRIIDRGDNKQNYNIAKTVMLDGIRTDGKSDAVKAAMAGGQEIIYQLIRYSLDENGDVNVIDTAKEPPQSASIEEKYSSIVYGNDSLTRNLTAVTANVSRSSQTFAPVCYAGGAVMFRVPKNIDNSIEYNESCFAASNISTLTDHASYKFDFFDADENMSAGALVVYSETGTTGSEISLQTPDVYQPSLMVESVVTALDEDGSTTKKITCFYAGTFSSYIIPSGVYEELEKQGLMPKGGDIIRLAFSRNKISGISVDVQYNTETRRPVVKNYIEGSYTYRTMVAGKVFSRGGGLMSIIADYYPSSSTLYDSLNTFTCSTGNVVVFDTEKQKCIPARLTDVVSVIRGGEDAADYACVRTDYQSASAVFLYRD